MSAMGDMVEAWSARMAALKDSAALPAHHDRCLGCGPDNPHGHHLHVWRDSDAAVVTRHIFDARHMGAPGVAHGGAVATVVDDLFGFLLYLAGELGVTRRLEVDYLAPVLLGSTYTVRAELVRREGRKLFLAAEGVDEAGTRVLSASALFIVVTHQHFSPRPG
ncbi:MAG: PaaI family thioesterase [Acidimicrobiales bacterium]